MRATGPVERPRSTWHRGRCRPGDGRPRSRRPSTAGTGCGPLAGRGRQRLGGGLQLERFRPGRGGVGGEDLRTFHAAVDQGAVERAREVAGDGRRGELERTGEIDDVGLPLHRRAEERTRGTELGQRDHHRSGLMVSAPGRDGRVVDAVASRYDVLGGTRAPLAALVVALVVSLAWRVRRSRRRAICRGIAVTRLSKATSSACPGDATDTANAPPWLDEIVDVGRPLGVTSSCSAAHAPPLPHLPIQIHGLVSRGTRTSSAVSLSSPSPPGCSPTRISVRPAAPAPATARRGTSDGRWHPTRLAARLPA